MIQMVSGLEYCAYNTGYIKSTTTGRVFSNMFRFTGCWSTKTDSRIEGKLRTFHRKWNLLIADEDCLKQVNFVRKFADFKGDDRF